MLIPGTTLIKNGLSFLLPRLLRAPRELKMAHFSHHHAYSGQHVYSGGKNNRIPIDSPRANDLAMSWRSPWELKWNHLKAHCTKPILKRHEYLQKPKLNVQECKFKNDKHEFSSGIKLCFSKWALLNKLAE